MSNDNLKIDLVGITPEGVAEVLTLVHRLREDGTNAMPEDTGEELWRTAASSGWTSEHLEGMRAALLKGKKTVQLAALDRAIANGGYITRAEVYEIGGYPADRKLNNWTSPFDSVVHELVSSHGLPEDAESPIVPDYGTGSGWRRAHGFEVAPELVKLARLG